MNETLARMRRTLTEGGPELTYGSPIPPADVERAVQVGPGGLKYQYGAVRAGGLGDAAGLGSTATIQTGPNSFETFECAPVTGGLCPHCRPTWPAYMPPACCGVECPGPPQKPHPSEGATAAAAAAAGGGGVPGAGGCPPGQQYDPVALQCCETPPCGGFGPGEPTPPRPPAVGPAGAPAPRGAVVRGRPGVTVRGAPRAPGTFEALGPARTGGPGGMVTTVVGGDGLPPGCPSLFIIEPGSGVTPPPSVVVPPAGLPTTSAELPPGGQTFQLVDGKYQPLPGEGKPAPEATPLILRRMGIPDQPFEAFGPRQDPIYLFPWQAAPQEGLLQAEQANLPVFLPARA